MERGHRRSALRLLAVAVAVGLGMALPGNTLAHPLGNFTINHYAEIRVEVDRILLDIVVDHAEIPTFQARQHVDRDGDGSLSDEEIEVGRIAACDGLGESIALTVGGEGEDLILVGAGLRFPLGAGGLPTMRQVCAFEAHLGSAIGTDPVAIGFSDGSYAERLGWREIVARGSGVTLRAVDGDLRAGTISGRLSAYPEGRLTTPLSDESLTVEASSGGPALGAFDVPDAEPLTRPLPSTAGPRPPATDQPLVVPGGIGGGELPVIFRQADLTPLALVLSLVTAAALGAGHALTPGHGKTLMAAYLVGTRGSARHALGLGISVSVSHTAGILALAATVVAAADILPAEVVVRWAPVVAAVSIVAIGGWMLVGELRRRRRLDGTPAHDHGHALGHDHDHDHRHDHGHGHTHDDGHAHGPTPGSTITWKGLFVLGLAGGLIPSTSALLILLGSIAAGRPAFGFILVVAFGLGMAAVMSGVGIALVAARDRVGRLRGGAGVARIRAAVPMAAAAVVLGFGVVLTAQALTAVPAI